MTRTPQAVAELAEEAETSCSSSGIWVVPLDEEIEAVADQLAGDSSSIGRRTQVGLAGFRVGVRGGGLLVVLLAWRQGSCTFLRLCLLAGDVIDIDTGKD